MSDMKKIKLIVSEEQPANTGKAHPIHVDLVDEHFRTAKPIAARLCGGTTTCMAIVETE